MGCSSDRYCTIFFLSASCRNLSKPCFKLVTTVLLSGGGREDFDSVDFTGPFQQISCGNIKLYLMHQLLGYG